MTNSITTMKGINWNKLKMDENNGFQQKCVNIELS